MKHITRLTKFVLALVMVVGMAFLSAREVYAISDISMYKQPKNAIGEPGKRVSFTAQAKDGQPNDIHLYQWQTKLPEESDDKWVDITASMYEAEGFAGNTLQAKTLTITATQKMIDEQRLFRCQIKDCNKDNTSQVYKTIYSNSVRVIRDGVFVGQKFLTDGQYVDNSQNVSTTKPANNNYAYYNNGVLTLHNFTYSGRPGQYHPVRKGSIGEYTTICSELDLKIVLEGENILFPLSREVSSISGIVCDGLLTITGPGKIQISASADSIYAEKALIIDGAKINIDTVSYGNAIQGQGVTIKNKADISVSASGSSFTISSGKSNSITISDSTATLYSDQGVAISAGSLTINSGSNIIVTSYNWALSLDNSVTVNDSNFTAYTRYNKKNAIKFKNDIKMNFSEGLVVQASTSSTDGSNLETYNSEKHDSYLYIQTKNLDPAPAKPHKIANVVSGVHVYWAKTNGATKYGLWRSQNGRDGEYSLVNTTTATHLIDATTTSGKTYFYKVSTVNANGEHSLLSEALGIAFVGTPDITSRFNKAAGITVGWNKIDGATGYAIYRKSYSGSDAWERVGTVSGNSTFTWQDTSVKNENGKVYRYTVRALAGSNMKTLSGCRNTGRTMARLTSRDMTGASKASSTSIKCSWTTSSVVTGYEVRFMIGSNVYKTFTVGNPKTGVKTFTGLKSGQTYKIQVRSYLKVDGMGFYSAWSTAATMTLK